jgi:hypothetical protein
MLLSQFPELPRHPQVKNLPWANWPPAEPRPSEPPKRKRDCWYVYSGLYLEQVRKRNHEPEAAEIDPVVSEVVVVNRNEVVVVNRNEVVVVNRNEVVHNNGQTSR